MASPEAIIPIPGKFQQDLRDGEILEVVYVEKVSARGPGVMEEELRDCHMCHEGELVGADRRWELLSNGRLIIIGSIFNFKCDNEECPSSPLLYGNEGRIELRSLIKASPAIPIAQALQERGQP